MKKILIHIAFFVFNLFTINAQQLVYSDILYGGVTGNGATTAFGSGTINIITQIPPSSTIKKAYLIAARDSLANDITVMLNGVNYIFNDNTIITEGFNSITNLPLHRPNSSIHFIDITEDIDSSISNYSLVVPPQLNMVQGFYSFFYLYIVYENPSLSKLNCNLFLNYKDVAYITNYNLDGLVSIDTTKPVSLAVATNYFCDTTTDGSYMRVNNDTIGLLGGADLNSSLWNCAGTYANFAHYNDSLFGLDDDTPDSLMSATDAFADIKSYVNNGDTVIDLNFIYQSNAFPLTNPIRAVMLSYSTPCDTFNTGITANDTICFGDSVQLQATGGATYNWFGAFGGLSDTSIANPKASPSQTTTYICTITNDSGCVKTEQVKIWVNPLPKPDTIIITNNVCGDSSGIVNVGNIPNSMLPYNYQITNLQNTNITNQNTNLFDSLVAGNYEILIIDSNGCQWQDTLTVNEVTNVVANFTATPNSGTAPLEVDFDNNSLNANSCQWLITGNELDTLVWIPACAGNAATCGLQHLFEQSGTYETCLIAYNNLPTCADTICKTILINESEDSLTLIIPNIFTPNQDGENDNFVIQLIGAKNLEKLNVQVFNRWGELLRNNEFSVMSDESTQNKTVVTQYTIWNGRTTAGKKVPDGTYFYVINYSLKDASTTLSEHRKKGSVTLLR